MLYLTLVSFNQHFQKTMPDKYSDDFEVVVEEADRIKISMKKMKRWVIVSGAARV